MRIAKLLCLTVVLLTPTCARAAARNVQTGADGRLANTRWVLASFGDEGVQSSVVEGATITLNFGDDGRASGSAGCNSYGGAYTERGDGLSFGPLMSTKGVQSSHFTRPTTPKVDFHSPANRGASSARKTVASSYS